MKCQFFLFFFPTEVIYRLFQWSLRKKKQKNVSFYVECMYVRDECKTKKTFQFGHCPNWGGGLPLPEFFCALFLLKEKVSSMVATAERVGKVARIGGWGGVWLIRAMPELKRFF